MERNVLVAEVSKLQLMDQNWPAAARLCKAYKLRMVFVFF